MDIRNQIASKQRLPPEPKSFAELKENQIIGKFYFKYNNQNNK